MPRPALFFFNEQDGPQLAETFVPTTLTQLRVLRAGVSMGLRDLSDERARVVRALNDAEVPVTGWLLLPRDEGYFATHANADRVEAAYERFHAWTRTNALRFQGVGLDFEPDIRELDQLMERPGRTLAQWLFRRGRGAQVAEAVVRYRALIDQVKADGFSVEAYQFPTIVDDRQRGSRFWQATLGALDVSDQPDSIGAGPDREVVMLYTSLLGLVGPGLLESYAPHCRSVGIGSTGGGIDPFPKLTWAELERDLVVASRFASEVFIFSLEGCLTQGFLPRLTTVEWERQLVTPPSAFRFAARGARFFVQQLCRLG